MKSPAWRLVLPTIQLVAAFGALVYAPYELAARYHVTGDDFMLLGHRSVFPPPTLRLVYAMNFPAVVVSYLVQFAGWGQHEAVHYQGSPLVSLSTQNCVFLVAVGVLWCVIGSMLDKRNSEETVSICKTSGVASLAPGFLFSLGVATLAIYFTMHTDADRPLREIGFAGLVWAVFLLRYFTSNLVAVVRAASWS